MPVLMVLNRGEGGSSILPEDGHVLGKWTPLGFSEFGPVHDFTHVF